MGIKLLGYSERGLINSLFYELGQRDQDGRHLCRLLGQVYFPNGASTSHSSEITILLEQSFSDFGDADTVLLIKNAGRKQAVFIEAKVKTWERGKWLIEKEFEEFVTGIGKKRVSSSNLFTQLYHKQRLADGILEKGIDYLSNEGLPFPDCSTKTPRKLGKNEIVLRAAKMIKEYLDDVFFVGIVPEKIKNIEKFVDSKLRLFNPGKDPNWHWSVENWGWLSWKTIKNFCEAIDFENTLGNFEHNEEQIFD